MKAPIKRRLKIKDENLFGLLGSHKSNNTYIKVLVSEEDGIISVQLTGNPKNWSNISDKKYDNYRELRRLDIGNPKLSIKFLTPGQLVKILGTQLGIKIPVEKVNFINKLNDDDDYFIMEMPIKYQKKVLNGMKKILNLKPQKKYEIIEKCIAVDQEQTYD